MAAAPAEQPATGFSKSGVSFVIPAHNESKLIAKTLDNLQQAIELLKLEAEIVVVDDASTDDTAEIARRLGARVVSVNLRNIGAVRNAGAASANRSTLIFVDADTIVPARTVRATIAAIDNGAIAGGADVKLGDGPPIHWSKAWVYPLAVTIWLRLGRWAAGCYMFCRAADFDAIGGFPEAYFAAEEFFFSREMKKRGRFVVVREPVFTSRRKLNDYSAWQLIRFIFRPFFSRGGPLKSRTGLEILYNDPRQSD